MPDPLTLSLCEMDSAYRIEAEAIRRDKSKLKQREARHQQLGYAIRRLRGCDCPLCRRDRGETQPVPMARGAMVTTKGVWKTAKE